MRHLNHYIVSEQVEVADKTEEWALYRIVGPGAQSHLETFFGASLAPLKRGQTVVAFAAETEDLEARGRRKMESKGADLIVVNDVGKPGIGFEAEENEVLILRRDVPPDLVTRRAKAEVADRIWDAFLAARGAGKAARA